MQVKLILGDSYKEVAKLEENSVDSIVCDPPYMIGFMGKEFDKAEGNIAGDIGFWKLCLRVLKPGGHLLAFGGSRTEHRLTCAIEDAGFQIRDKLCWIFASGFPKSLNLHKQLLKQNHPEAEKAKGLGTALKPAVEFITLARKPLSEPTIVKNFLKHGTGAIDIDGCRIPTSETIIISGDRKSQQRWKEQDGRDKKDLSEIENTPYENTQGRFPANICVSQRIDIAINDLLEAKSILLDKWQYPSV